MGGNLLPGCRRLNSEEYTRVCETLTVLLRRHYSRVVVPKSVTSKTSHGDVDFVVSGIAEATDVASSLGSDFIHRNGPTTSYNYQGYQVDIHTCPEEEFESCVVYKSNGDIGNLLGRIATKMGLIYGMDGLSIRVYYKTGEVYLDGNSTWESRRLVLSRNPEVFFDYLGVSYARWLEGFETEQDVFDYLTGSKYFSQAYFVKTEEYNHAARMRNKKRPQFIRFIAHLNSRDDWRSGEPVPTKQDAIQAFGMTGVLAEFREEVRSRFEFTQRFSASLVMSLTGLTGAALGVKMKQLRQVVTPENSRDTEWLYREIRATPPPF